MVTDLLGAAELPDRIFSVIEERAEGNPFFIEEVVRELMESSAIVHDGDTWNLTVDPETLHIPGGIVGLLTARMDRLDDSSRLVLQLASVLGREFEFSELGELTQNLEQTETALFDLLRRDMLIEVSRIPTRVYAFRHALIQETAYDTILLKTRRALHAQIAEHLIARDGEPHDIARHLLEARREQEAVPYLAEAGDRASRAMSLADAIRDYDQALTWGADADVELTRHIYEGLGAAYTLIPDLTEASSSYQRMLEYGREHGEPSVQITALNRLGFTAAALGGDYETATEHLEQARLLAEEFGDGAGLAEYHINSCLIATTRGDMEKAAAHDAETIRLGYEVGANDLMMHGLLQRVLSLVHATQYDEAQRTMDKALEAAEGTTNPNVEAMLVSAEYFFLLRDGEITEAWNLSRDGADESARVGSSVASTIALMAGAAGDLRGDPENALAYFTDAMRRGESSGQFFNSASAAASMARIYAEIGIENDETTSLRRAATEYMNTPLGGMLASTVLLELGRIEALGGRLDEADELFASALAGSSAVKNLEMPALLFALATTRLARGDTVAARSFIEEGAQFAHDREMAVYLPLEALTRGAVLHRERQYDDAVETLTAGAEQAARSGMLGLEWRLRAAAAESLAEAGRPNEAMASLAAARRLISDLANRILDTTMSESFVSTATAQLPNVAAISTGGDTQTSMGGSS
jgi:tetratricopeptide (TPR) repeat protein